MDNYPIGVDNEAIVIAHVQSRARVLRSGQTRAVVFAHIVADGTIDEAVYRALEARVDVVAAIVGAHRPR